MPLTSCLLFLCLINQIPKDHPDNPLYRDLVTQGLNINGLSVSLPEPSLPDAQDVEASKLALIRVAGDERSAKELLRDSITAPFILKTRDVKAGDAIVRVADLWFVVHVKLEEVDLENAVRQADNQAVEAGNMRFESKLLTEADLLARKIQPLGSENLRKEWFTHLNSRLLDRITVEVTDHAVATRSAGSLLIASRTDPSFDGDRQFPNHWASLSRKGNAEIIDSVRMYPGGISYVKITELACDPGVLFVEAHLAYVEPMGWFEGNPILRSKLSVIAQDQIRKLRRGIDRRRTEAKKQIR